MKTVFTAGIRKYVFILHESSPVSRYLQNSIARKPFGGSLKYTYMYTVCPQFLNF